MRGKVTMPDLKELQQALDDERREVQNLTVMGMRPDLKPEHAELVRNLERSARARARLAHQALQHHLQSQDQRLASTTRHAHEKPPLSHLKKFIQHTVFTLVSLLVGTSAGRRFPPQAHYRKAPSNWKSWRNLSSRVGAFRKPRTQI
jgi:hypothetical protein